MIQYKAATVIYMQVGSQFLTKQSWSFCVTEFESRASNVVNQAQGVPINPAFLYFQMIALIDPK